MLLLVCHLFQHELKLMTLAALEFSNFIIVHFLYNVCKYIYIGF
jgi:hypothetical protein